MTFEVLESEDLGPAIRVYTPHRRNSHEFTIRMENAHSSAQAHPRIQRQVSIQEYTQTHTRSPLEKHITAVFL